MFYWFIVNPTTGNIGTGSSTHPPDTGIVPDGFEMVGEFTSLDPTQQAAFDTPAAYLYQNETFVENPAYDANAVALTQAIANQLKAVGAGYMATIAAGFQSNATGTLDTYAIDASAYPKWTGILAVIDSGNGPTTQQVKDIQGNKVTLTAAQFKTFALDGFNFLNAQEQQLWSLQDQIEAQTEVPLTPVTWVQGAYTPQPAPSS